MTVIRAKSWKTPSRAPASDGNETIATLRRSHEVGAEAIQIRYRDADLWIEMQQGARLLVCGNWRASLRLGEDSELCPVGGWSQLCWNSDRDADYLELELPLKDGWKLQRQILLAREDNFIYLADAALAPDNINGHRPLISLTSELNLGPQVAARPADESREVFLTAGGKKIAAALPLALPEWRVERGPGEFEAAGQRLRWQLLGEGRAVLAPLWIDLDAGRARKPLTWRRLTVAEDRRAVAREMAVGYRVQAGAEQWLIYRSLMRRGNRTVLGYNTAYEFGAVRFLSDGTTKPILEIE
jgi:hypothetical protein